MNDTGRDDTVRVMLVRMEGKLDMSNMRHDQTDVRLNNHEQRLHRHSTDISTLQQKEMLREGERKGLTIGGKIAWAGISGLAGTGIGAVLLKMIGG